MPKRAISAYMARIKRQQTPIPDIPDEIATEGRFGRRTQTRASPHYRQVYFIEAPELGVIKIGCADDAKRRLGQLQAASPSKLVLRGVFYTDDAPRLESDLHDRFNHLWIRGEWFQADDDLRSLAESAPEYGDDMMKLEFNDPPPGAPAPLLTVWRQPGEDPETFATRVMRHHASEFPQMYTQEP